MAGNAIHLRSYGRYNGGANPLSTPLRYPEDQFDRIWSPRGFKSGNPCKSVSTISKNVTLPITTQERPPLKVMQSAWICTISRIAYFDHDPLPFPAGPLITYGYFRELDDNASAYKVRGMDFYANDIKITQFNTSNQALEISTSILQISENYWNFTFRQALWSQLPPMINAFELYTVYGVTTTVTADEEGIQSSFNLTSWTGDPCFPEPFKWLNCTKDPSISFTNDLPKSRIAKLFLAYKGSMPTLPPEIAGLSRLTHLNVSGIQLSEFPSSLSTLKNLTELDLSNNNLSGSVERFINNISSRAVQRLNVARNSLEGIFSIDQLAMQLPELKVGRFDRNKNIGGTLNLSSWHASLMNVTQRGEGVLVNASVGLLISLTYNNIDNIFPGEDVLTPAIETLLGSPAQFAKENGILLGGNPWCTNKKVKHLSLAREYLCRVSTSYFPKSKTKSSSTGKRTAIVVGSTFGACAFVVCIISLLFARKLRIQFVALKEIQDVLAKEKVYPPLYSYHDLRAAPKKFSKGNYLGKGNFGIVYRSKFADGTVMAVKQLLPSKKALSEFLNETVLITGIKHRNLLQLRGCCIKEHQRLLVYEYAENGNLADALWGNSSNKCNETCRTMLDWGTRLKICVGIARGLSYLHEELQPRIIHRDIKPSNVLLDSALNAKIADFGLARPFEEYESHAEFTDVAGTLCYLAPEYAIEGQLTDKADVYSFGLVALEIVSGRKCIDYEQAAEKISLQTWVRNLRQNGDLFDILDPSVKTASDEEKDEVRRVIDVACACLNPNPALRPAMSKALVLMHGREDGDGNLQLGEIPCSEDEDEDEDEWDPAQSSHLSGLPDIGSALRPHSTSEEFALLDSHNFYLRRSASRRTIETQL